MLRPIPLAAALTRAISAIPTAAWLAGAVATLPAGAWAQSTMPPVPPPSGFEREISEARVPVRRIVVEGATSIAEADIRAVVAPFEGRSLGEGDLRDIERRLTQLYLDRGFATSGVLLKRAPGSEGEAVFQAVEGTLAQVRFLEPPRYAAAGWLTSLLVPDPKAPIRLDDLQERMTAMREAGIVERINAQVVPLDAVGASELVVGVEERRPWDVEIRYDNYHSPVIGARRPTLWGEHRNPTGWGDRLDAHIGSTTGLEDFHVAYSAPWPRTPWRFGARYERSDSLAIDPPTFRELAITSVSDTARGEVSYAWIAAPGRSLTTGVAFERRESESKLLGLPFSFTPGLPDGLSRLDAARVYAEYSQGGADAVLFLRGQWSEGRLANPILPVAGAPEERFRALGLQAQYARRLNEAGAQLVARIDGQYSPDVLVPIEKKAIGGVATVRGYRENLLLKDRAVAGTIEARWPVWRYQESVRVTLAAFVDAGWARDTIEREGSLPSSIVSAGVGVAVSLPYGFSLRLDAAVPNHRWLTERADAQDRGVHFQLTWSFPR